MDFFIKKNIRITYLHSIVTIDIYIFLGRQTPGTRRKFIAL